MNSHPGKKAMSTRDDFLDILECALQSLSYDYVGEARSCLDDMEKLLDAPELLGLPEQALEESICAIEDAREALAFETRDVRKAVWFLWKLHRTLRRLEATEDKKQFEGVLVAAGEPYHLGRLFGPDKMRFGGLVVEYGPGNKFYLSVPSDPYSGITIDEADVTDTIKFMLHHFRPCFPGSIQKSSHAA